MLIIGITGGIGCGKSEVLRFLESQGAYIIEADKLAHTLMKKGETAYYAIVKEFSEDVLSDDGQIDRVKLGKKVFNNDEALKKLNRIVHPAVKDYILSDIDAKKTYGNIDFYVIEAALLIQDGYRDICDEIWYVYADVNIRLDRLIKGRGGDADKYMTVINSQDDEEFYKNNSDVIIDNNGNFEKTQNVLKGLLNKSR